ncbi:MAG: glycosyltransferase [Spirochaetales bacterium]|nr:glycosyltransferase [Spirochaetales bacterium]
MDKRYNILNIIDKSMTGGGQQCTYMTAAFLDRKVFHSYVACSPGGPLVERCKRKGLTVKTIVMNKRFSLRSVLVVYCFVKEKRIDLIHAHGLVAAVFAVFAAKACRIPIIYSQHGFHYRSYKGRFLQSLRIMAEKCIIRLINMVICDSDDNLRKGEAEGYFPAGKGRRVFPPIETDSYHISPDTSRRIKTDLGIAGCSPIIGTVGRLDEAKGFPTLLKALVAVVAEFAELRFLLIGEGPERKMIERKRKALGLESHVILTGYQPDIMPLVGLFDVFVSSSYWEGLPLALCEAHMLGKPVVATGVGGCPEIVVHEETGLIVEPGNPDALAVAVLRLLRDPAKCRAMGRKAKEHVTANFGVEHVIGEIEGIYGNLLNHERDSGKRTVKNG